MATYFGGLGENLPLVADSGVDGLHVDLTRAPGELDAVLARLHPRAILSAGVVDGRNVWRTDLDAAHGLLRRAVKALGRQRVLVAPSCSLLHVPVDLEAERKLDPTLRTWLAFSAQKLDEIRALADCAEAEGAGGRLVDETRRALASRRTSPRTHNPDVRARAAEIDDSMLRRPSPFVVRIARQHARFGLPMLPTTTIGSFPQTADVRAARAAWRAGKMTDGDYDGFLKTATRRCIEKQEELGLDVLVHGEFERNDMVEYFGEQLEGFAFTENGWVQSYGSRCVKPPVLFGDVARPRPMTVEWSRFAQSLTKRPMKGMLTGPVTILQWSFVRDDQPRSATCRQIALALRDEVRDLEAAGIPMIQVDEPAVREGLPLRQSEWKSYLRWAVDGFRLATAGVRDETQIHTHMCYAEFGDILEAVAEMDADVLSIETSRSKMELLLDFGHFRYPNDVGPGVYDIHSPRVPTRAEMEACSCGRPRSFRPVACGRIRIVVSRRAAGRKWRARSRAWSRPRVGHARASPVKRHDDRGARPARLPSLQVRQPLRDRRGSQHVLVLLESRRRRTSYGDADRAARRARGLMPVRDLRTSCIWAAPTKRARRRARRRIMSFPHVTAKDWRAQVDKELAGTPFEKALVHRTAEGLPIQPLYTEGPGGAGIDVDARLAPFCICLRVDAAARAETVNDELEGGADALWLDAASADVALAAPGIARVFLVLECAGASPQSQLDRLSARLSPEAAFALGADPFADVARGLLAPAGVAGARDALVQAARTAEEKWPRATVVTISTLPYHDAGADAADELGIALATGAAYLESLVDGGLSPAAAGTPHRVPAGGGTRHVRRDVQAEGASRRLAQGAARGRRDRGASPSGARRLLVANPRAARPLGEHAAGDDPGLRRRPRRRRSRDAHGL